MNKKSTLLVLGMCFSCLVFSQDRPPMVSAKFDVLRSNTASNSNVQTQSGSPIRLDAEVYVLSEGYVAVEAMARSSAEAPQLLADLEALGLQYGASFGRMVGGMMPLEAISEETMSQVPTLEFIRPTVSDTEIGAVDSQADVAQLSDEARSLFGVDGEGIKVGILSDSYNTLGGADDGVASGDLPGEGNPNGFAAPVDVLLELPEGGSDEGRAMAEIVHDVAPGAELAFHTAVISQPNFASGILALANAGSDVVVDDIRFFTELFFQDGIIAQAIDSVFNQGVSYFSSAGNYLDRAYDSDFRDGGTVVLRDAAGDSIGTYLLHDFDTSQNVNAFLPVNLDSADNLRSILSWDEPGASACDDCPGAETEIDFFLARTDQDENSVFRSLSSEEVSVGGDPLEFINIRANTSTQLYLLVGKRVADDGSVSDKPLKIKIVDRGNADIPFTTEIGGTGYGHSNANGAIATGAVRYTQTPAFGVDPPRRESFSSSGGIPIFFDTKGNRTEPELRLKPNVSTAQGANNTFFGSSDFEGDGFPNFFGTSASAPHAAGVAALMLDATDKGISPTEIREAMESTAQDMKPTREVLPAPPPGADPKFDFDTGHGFLLATEAIASVSSQPSVLHLLVVDASTEEVITKINDGDSLDLATLPGTDISIKAEAVAGRSTLQSVRFRLEGPRRLQYTDRQAPYFIRGDRQGRPRAWRASDFGTGEYQLTAAPLAANYGEDSASNDLRVSFTLINGTTADDSIALARQTGEDSQGVLNGLGTVRIFPNPTETGTMTYTFSSQQEDVPVMLFVYDMKGHLIANRSFQGAFSEKLDLSQQRKGVYLTKLIVGDKQYVERVMVAE